MLTQVDNLDFTVIVDNCIEWFSTLPEGFIHELPQHLRRPDAPKDELTGLPFIDFEHMCCGAHGLAVYMTTMVDGKQFNVLLDGGPEGISFERNAQAMRAPLEKLDAIVLSHWHRDHSGGILKALQLRQATNPSLPPVKVDLHPTRPIRRGVCRPPDRTPIVALPVDPTFDEITARNGTIDLHDEDHEITSLSGDLSGVGVSGFIKRRWSFEVGLPGAITWMDEDGKGDWFTDEQIADERYVVVDVIGKGLVVFSSCSHAGICNVLSDAMEKYDRPIHMVVGGLHLVPTNQQPVKETVDFLSRRLQPPPKYILPLHCTGLEARAEIRKAMGQACIPAGVGMKVMVAGEKDKEEALNEVELKVLN